MEKVNNKNDISLDNKMDSRFHGNDEHLKKSQKVTYLLFFCLLLSLLLSACGAGGTEVGNPGPMPSSAYSPLPLTPVEIPSGNAGVLPPDNSETENPPEPALVTLNHYSPGETLNLQYGNQESTYTFQLLNISPSFLSIQEITLSKLDSASHFEIQEQDCPEQLPVNLSCFIKIRISADSLNESRGILRLKLKKANQEKIVEFPIKLQKVENTELEISGSITPYPSPAREIFDLNLNLRNSGTYTLYNAHLQFNVPAGITIRSTNLSCFRQSAEAPILCPLPQLARGNSLSIQFKVFGNEGSYVYPFEIFAANLETNINFSLEGNILSIF